MSKTAMLTRAERRQVQRSAAVQRQAGDADSPLAQLQARANAGPHATSLAALQASVAQRVAANRTGLPDRLRAGLESLSGRDLSGIRVHYNSPKPAQLAAHAFAQGSEIHLAPGQERHLPHEGWHGVQQMEGRVRPTMQLHGTAINDNAALEREADTMGALAQRQPDRGVAPGGRVPQDYQGLRRNRSGAPAQLTVQPRLAMLASRPAHVLQQQTRSLPVHRVATNDRLTGDRNGVVQRIVKLTASDYAVRIVAQGGLMTRDLLADYIDFALMDDADLAYSWATNQQQKQLDKLKDERKNLPTDTGDMTLFLHYLDGVATMIYRILSQARINGSTKITNAQTRYSSAPGLGYSHTNLNPGDAAVTWDSITEMQQKFGRAAGPHLLAAPKAVPRADRQGDTRTPKPPALKQLTWPHAKRYLPRPLLNLLFDVKSQLIAGAMVVDERTKSDHKNKNVTPDDPGTLRSWHEDSNGILPEHAHLRSVRPGKPELTTPGGVRADVPVGSQLLHAHYTSTSTAGSGTRAGTAKAPMGFAEYTGTGIKGDVHNVKIVLDYASGNPRVYLTLTHYQYWGIVTLADGSHKVIECNTQELALAQGVLENDASVKEAKAAGRPYELMNPWIEVLVP